MRPPCLWSELLLSNSAMNFVYEQCCWSHFDHACGFDIGCCAMYCVYCEACRLNVLRTVQHSKPCIQEHCVEAWPMVVDENNSARVCKLAINASDKCLARRRVDEAASILERYLHTYPPHAEVLRRLGQIRLSQGRPKDAAPLLRQALDCYQTR